MALVRLLDNFCAQTKMLSLTTLESLCAVSDDPFRLLQSIANPIPGSQTELRHALLVSRGTRDRQRELGPATVPGSRRRCRDIRTRIHTKETSTKVSHRQEIKTSGAHVRASRCRECTNPSRSGDIFLQVSIDMYIAR